MTNAERKKRILELVSRNRSVQITDLTELFDVSVMTIRRDLAELEEKKYIKRVYGGAVLNEEELLMAAECIERGLKVYRRTVMGIKD